MSIDEVIARFITLCQACRALEITPQNMTQWKRQGYIPYLQQHRIAVLTEGELMPDDRDPAIVKRELRGGWRI